MVTVASLTTAIPRLQVLADGAGPGQHVRWVHVSELTDPTPYLRGHELLLTAGVHLPKTAAATEAYVARLVDAGVTGVGFGVDPVYRKVPPRLVTACRARGLLLLRVPPDVPFLAISEAHVRELEEGRIREATMTATVQQKLLAAATRPDPLQAIVATAATQLGAGVLLRDPRQGGRWQAGTLDPQAEAITAQLLTPHPRHRSVTVHEPGRHIIAQRLEVSGRPMALALTASTGLPPGSSNVTNIAATAIALVSGHVSTARLRALGEATTRAALGAPPEALEPAASRTFRQPTDGTWRVLACTPLPNADPLAWRTHVAGLVATVLRIDEEDILLAVIPEPADPTRIVGDLTGHTAGLGLSDPGPWAALPAAARQARQRCHIQAAKLGRQGDIPHVQDLLEPSAARTFATHLLGPVLDLPAEQSAQLLRTLQGWLQSGGHWDAAAAALAVHRNTVRNRITRITRLLALDLDDPAVRVDLWLALHWTRSATASDRPALDYRERRV